MRRYLLTTARDGYPKRKQRKAEKDVKQAKREAETFHNIQQWWDANRAKLSIKHRLVRTQGLGRRYHGERRDVHGRR